MTERKIPLETEVAAIRSIADAVGWATTRLPPAVFLTAIAQDEFTFDVVVRVDPQTYVVFDTT